MAAAQLGVGGDGEVTAVLGGALPLGPVGRGLSKDFLLRQISARIAR
jgi:hypothetical protein